ncbi:hypothetical protein QFZ26_001428 [Agromyces ramosus]|uniref:Uncharacterized protein n=1 Tax=Agromyces ramosus TaxID=33879 RepID=A0ABU0R730_9MICO|nr:hypothetical protein [Agromyces ramosus]
MTPQVRNVQAALDTGDAPSERTAQLRVLDLDA